MPDLLFEIGTEELPPALIPNLTEQVKANIINSLKNNNITINETKIFYTPRRISVYAKNLPDKQEIQKSHIKGPQLNKAFEKSGQATPALEGFLKKNNIKTKDIISKKINNIDYVFAEITTGGQRTSEILKNILPNAIKQTTGEKFMTWGNYDDKFSRPIRWILAIFDNQVIEFTYNGVKSNKYSFGHKFLAPQKLILKSPHDYESLLEKNYVIVCPHKRKEKIIITVNKILTEKKAMIPENMHGLYDLLTNITEYPLALVCTFDPKFLILPQIVIETVLAKHQKFIALFNKDSKTILSDFIVITNGTEMDNEQIKEKIKKGNEKVVRARLNDAKFFMEEDLKRPFTYEERIEDLEKITFQKGVGSMKDKVERLVKLSLLIYDMLATQNKEMVSPYNKEVYCNKQDLIETAKLCKVDLTTHMVFEMPELQGSIGSIYTNKNHIKEEICKGIQEHYSNPDPNNTIAQIIGLADRLDNIICLFSINKIPTGSTDPFALRSQTYWIFSGIKMIEHQYKVIFNLSEIVDLFRMKVANGQLRERITNEIIKKVEDFLIERLKLYFLTKYPGYRLMPDIVEAAFSIGKPLNNIQLIAKNLKLLSDKFLEPSEDDKAFLIAAKRLIRILEKNTNGNVDLNILKHEEEKTLFKMFEEINNNKYKNNEEYYNSLKQLTNPINSFFDKVLVNDPDPKIKQARHALLKKAKDIFERLCDFNKIIERT